MSYAAVKSLRFPIYDAGEKKKKKKYRRTVSVA